MTLGKIRKICPGNVLQNCKFSIERPLARRIKQNTTIWNFNKIFFLCIETPVFVTNFEIYLQTSGRIFTRIQCRITALVLSV